MGFKSGFTRFYDFGGTMTRSCFFLFFIAVMFGQFVANLGFFYAAAMSSGTAFVLFIVAAYLAIAFFTASARRCRSAGYSGWMVLLHLVPLVNIFFILFLLFKRDVE